MKSYTVGGPEPIIDPAVSRQILKMFVFFRVNFKRRKYMYLKHFRNSQGEDCQRLKSWKKNGL